MTAAHVTPNPAERSGIFSEGPQLSAQAQTLLDEVFGAGAGARHALRYPWQYSQRVGASEPARLELFWHLGRVVGSLGWLPDTLYIEGVATPVRFTADLTSAAAYRNRGVGARLLKRLMSEPVDAGSIPPLPLAMAVSPDARSLLLRQGFEEVPLQVFFRVLSLEGLAHRKEPILMRDGRLAPPARMLLRLADGLEPSLEPLLGALSAARAATELGSATAGRGQDKKSMSMHHRLWAQLQQLPMRRRAAREVQVQEVSQPSQAVERLSQRLRTRWPVAFLPSQEQLQWRYRQHPQHSYRILEASRGGVLTGLACWRIFEELDGLRMAHLMELIADPDDAGTWDALLHAGLALLRHERVFAVKALSGHPGVSAWLARYAFLPHGDSPGLYFHAPEPTRRAALRRPWLVGLGASDTDV